MAAFQWFIVAAGLAVLAAAGPALAQGKVAKDSRRAYYVTQTQHFPSDAPAACDSGFHMASLSELLELTALKYDTTRGETKADSGEGAPSAVAG